MRLRPHQQTLAGRSPGAIVAGKYGGPARMRPARIRRIRRWFRIGALLTIIGVLRFARAMRAHWEPLFLLAGVLLMVGGYFLPVIGMFFPGLLVITVTLLKGNSDRMRGTRPIRPGVSTITGAASGPAPAATPAPGAGHRGQAAARHDRRNRADALPGVPSGVRRHQRP